MFATSVKSNLLITWNLILDLRGNKSTGFHQCKAEQRTVKKTDTASGLCTEVSWARIQPPQKALTLHTKQCGKRKHSQAHSIRTEIALWPKSNHSVPAILNSVGWDLGNRRGTAKAVWKLNKRVANNDRRQR
jgi:hypothetical protein